MARELWSDQIWQYRRSRGEHESSKTFAEMKQARRPQTSAGDAETSLAYESFGCARRTVLTNSSQTRCDRSRFLNSSTGFCWYRISRDSRDPRTEGSRRHRLYPAERELMSGVVAFRKEAVVPRYIESKTLRSPRRRMRPCEDTQPRDLAAWMRHSNDFASRNFVFASSPTFRCLELRGDFVVFRGL